MIRDCCSRGLSGDLVNDGKGVCLVIADINSRE